MTRERLPGRHRHDVAEIEHGGFKLIVGVGRYSDGRLGELFIDTHKGGTAIDTILRDSAILLSFALQAGIDATTPSARAWHPMGPARRDRRRNV
jgi:ribonucleoside-diphosphate reductase alpha chain